MASFSKLFPKKTPWRLASAAFHSLQPDPSKALPSWLPCSRASLLQTQVNEAGTWNSPSLEKPPSRHYSRPRGPLWRGRKIISKEALQAIQEMRRAKGNNARVGNIVQTKVARLLKTDLLAVLQELQRQDEVDLALKIFDVVRKEIWYKPDIYIYKDMLNCLGRNKRTETCQLLFKQLKKEGLEPNALICNEVMAAFLRVGMVPDAMEVFEELKQSSCPPDRLTYRILMKGLRQLRQSDLRRKVKKEYLEIFEGIDEGDQGNDENVGYENSDDEKSDEEDS